MRDPSRRAALALSPVALLAACAREAPPAPVEGPAISYRHLTPLRLDVASVEVDAGAPLTGPRDIGRELSPSAIEAVRIMGRDRLAALGAQGGARFSVTQAAIVPERLPAGGGLFAAQPGERLTGTFACRLDILDANGRRVAFCEAQTTRVRTTEQATPASRRNAAESLMRLAVFDLNTEFEFQLRRALRPYLVEGSGAAPAAPVEREALPPA